MLRAVLDLVEIVRQGPARKALQEEEEGDETEVAEARIGDEPGGVNAASDAPRDEGAADLAGPEQDAPIEATADRREAGVAES